MERVYDIQLWAEIRFDGMDVPKTESFLSRYAVIPVGQRWRTQGQQAAAGWWG